MTRALIMAWHKYTPFGDELVVDNQPNMCYNLGNEIHKFNAGEKSNSRR